MNTNESENIVGTPRDEINPSECWRKIPGVPDTYEASNCGRVRSIDHATNTSRGLRKYRGRIITPVRSGPRSYFGFMYWADDKCHRVEIHRAVALSWVPNPGGMPCVNHKDGHRPNNHPENLEWVSYQGNTLHARDITKRLHVGGRAAWSKLTDEAVREIRMRPNDKSDDVAADFNVSRATINLLRRGKTWRHVT